MKREALLLSLLLALACKNEEEPQDVIEDTVIHGSEAGERGESGGTEKTPAPRDRQTRPEREGDDPAAPLPGLRRQPTSPDPRAGNFTLADATEGLATGSQPLYAQIRTDLGRITCKLLADKAPRTVANFVGLARGKREFWDARASEWVARPAYDATIFHRVIPGFMIQGGDPLGDGSGTAGYEIPDEVWEGSRHDRAGLLCMANRGPDTNGAQFFITDASAPHLDGSYTILGECTPTDVVSRIARVPQTGRPRNRPLTPVQILSVRVTRGEPPPPSAPPPAKRPPR